MPKIDLVIPKGTKCKNGICEQDIEIEGLEIPEINPTIRRVPEVQIKGLEQAPQINNEVKSEVKEKIIEKEIKVVPSWQPNFICKGPNCNTKKNPAYAQRPKGKCSNCGQFTKESFGTCIWCQGKEIEELDESELDDLGIPTPEDNEPDLEEAD